MNKNIDKMISLSKEKKTMLNTILDLTNKQVNIIKNENLDLLESIIEDKETLIKKIDIIDVEFIELYNSIKEKEGIDTFDEINIKKYDNIKDLKDIVKDLNDILTEISKMDKENSKNMKLSIKEVKKSIKNVKKGKKAYKGYSYEGPASILIDEKK